MNVPCFQLLLNDAPPFHNPDSERMADKQGLVPVPGVPLLVNRRTTATDGLRSHVEISRASSRGRPLELANIELLHLEEGLSYSLDALFVVAGQEFLHGGGRDLP